jgi:hypothetical protein
MKMNPLFWLSIADIIAMVLCATRLWSARLSRVYWALFAHLLIEATISTLGLTLRYSEAEYLYLYYFDAASLWLLWTLIVANLNDKVLAAVPGLKWLGRWALWVGAGAAVAVGILLASADMARIAERTTWITLIQMTDRSLSAMLAAFLLALCGLLAYFSATVSRNCIYLSLGWGAIFTLRATVLGLAVYLNPEIFRILNLVLTGSTTVVFATWAALLSHAGEEVPQITGKAEDLAPRAIRKLAELGRAARGIDDN